MNDESTKMNTTISKYESQYPNCHLHVQTWKLYSVPLLMLSQNISVFFVLLCFVLVSILTKYLAARYLNHPFYKTLYRYIVWISVQFCIVAFCSNKFTLIFCYFAFPLLFLINWLVLLRDNRILCRVLRSNLTELELHSNNRVLYHEQVSGYRYYRFFQKVLLTYLSFAVVAVIILNIVTLIYLFNNSICLLNIVYRISHPLSIHIPLLPTQIAAIIDSTITITYSLIYSRSYICTPCNETCIYSHKL